VHPLSHQELSTAIAGKASTRRRRKDARPSELLAAGLELLVDRRFSATRVDDAARRARGARGLKLADQCPTRKAFDSGPTRKSPIDTHSKAVRLQNGCHWV